MKGLLKPYMKKLKRINQAKFRTEKSMDMGVNYVLSVKVIIIRLIPSLIKK